MFGLPNCKQVTEKSSQLVDDNLTRAEKFQLRIHLMVCHSCRAYVDKMRLTTSLLKHWVVQNKEMPESLAIKLEQEFNSEHRQSKI